MELEHQGGARVKVDEVDVTVSARAPDSDASEFTYLCCWTAAGSVGHWGHTHRRINRYEAAITIEPIAGVWKIKRIDLRQQQRIDPAA